MLVSAGPKGPTPVRERVNSVELVPNTFNPNPGFPKISGLVLGHRRAVIDSITLVFGRPPFLSRKGGGRQGVDASSPWLKN
jgi:hypothetical protein